MKKIMLLQGNEAVAIASLNAGLNVFAGYPITPASEVHHLLGAEYQKEKERIK